MRIDTVLEQKMEHAFRYLTKVMEESGHNDKPIVWHCLKVAKTLYDYGYEEDVIIGAILHDVLEDTLVTKEELQEEFGASIMQLVCSVTFDSCITDKKMRYEKLMEKSFQFGRKSLLIKCSDLLDNISYVKLVDTDFQSHLKGKYTYFLSLSKSIIGDEPIYTDLYNLVNSSFKESDVV